MTRDRAQISGRLLHYAQRIAPRGKVGCRRVHAISQIVQSCLLVSENRELHSKGPKPGGITMKRPRHARISGEIRGWHVKSSGRSSLARVTLFSARRRRLLFIGGERRMHVLTSRFDRNRIARVAEMRCGGCIEWRCIDGRYDGRSAVKPAAFHRRD